MSGLNGLSYNNTAVVQQGLMLMLMLMWVAIAEIGATAGWRSACNQHKSRNAHLCIFVGMSCLFSRENTPHTQQSFVLYVCSRKYTTNGRITTTSSCCMWYIHICTYARRTRQPAKVRCKKEEGCSFDRAHSPRLTKTMQVARYAMLIYIRVHSEQVHRTLVMACHG